MERDRAILRKDAIPEIFLESDPAPIFLKKNADPAKRKQEFLRNNGKKSDFSKIHSQANIIPLLSAYWFFNIFPLFIEWSSWSGNLENCLKKIIVKMDKSVTASTLV